MDNDVLFIWTSMGYTDIDMFAAWQGYFGRHRNIAFWNAMPHCIMWCLWQEWNSRSFEGREWTILEFKAFFFHTLLDWSVSFHSPPCVTLLDILEHCNLN